MKRFVLCLATMLVLAVSGLNQSEANSTKPKTQKKKWTLIVFLNGHNNLDYYGFQDINEMEKLGSDHNINVVVQWASLKNKKTHRLYVQKDDDPSTVTSPVIETMEPVDMGDYRNLIEFSKWAMDNYPAEHYFVDVWNHGNGWLKYFQYSTRDISYDDLTGNHITTEQLGYSMRVLAQHLGRPVDVYGSDACLMAMLEVASEMKGAVKYFLGSQELEPAEGWPYDKFLESIKSNLYKNPDVILSKLTEEYKSSYETGGSQCCSKWITLSALDMKHLSQIESAFKELTLSIINLSAEDRSKVHAASGYAQFFYGGGYMDLMDFLNQIKSQKTSINSTLIKNIELVMKDLVVSNSVGAEYTKSHGVSIWYPRSRSSLNAYAKRYSELNFNKNTNWVNALNLLLP